MHVAVFFGLAFGQERTVAAQGHRAQLGGGLEAEDQGHGQSSSGSPCRMSRDFFAIR